MASQHVAQFSRDVVAAQLEEHQLMYWSQQQVAGSTLHATHHADSIIICDDDSDDDAVERQMGWHGWHGVQSILLAVDLSAEKLADLQFSVVGVLVNLEILRPFGAKRRIAISGSVAHHLTGGVLPGDARVLQSGRLAPISGKYSLILPLDEHAQGDGRWLACGRSFFNFLLKQWQPMAGLVSYLPRRHLLYCAFTPEEDALFIKLGYRALGNNRREAVVKYVEKKSRKLRITNKYGSGLFLMPLPESHGCFDAPARAAEESLKSAIRSSQHLRANPSGCNGEFVAFSGSLEYYFVKAKPGKGTTLQALVSTLQDFTGNQNLKPFRSVMTPGEVRAGRTRLVEWRGPLETDKLQASSRGLPLPRASALLSLQKLHRLGAFSRRVSRCPRKASKISKLSGAKKRRKAWSCPL